MNLQDEESRHVMGTGLWKERLRRIGWRLGEAAGDIGRSFDWHIGGGKRFFERYYLEIVSAHKWCFIVGCNNSGTSLLQEILEHSGQVSTLPYEGQRYTRTLVRSRKRGHERVWSEYLDELKLTAEDSYTCVPRLVHDWMRDLPLPVREIVLEKTPANTMRMAWLQEAFPRSYFIGLVRNGYAVAEGIRRKGKKTLDRGARHWNLVNRIMVNDTRQIDNFLEVKYEDLVDNFAHTVRRIGAFLGVDPVAILAAGKKLYSASTVVGAGEYAIQNFNEQSIRRLSEADLLMIAGEAEEMLEYFGYVAGPRVDKNGRMEAAGEGVRLDAG